MKIYQGFAIGCAVVTAVLSARMEIIEQQTDLFKKCRVPTEAIASSVLRKNPVAGNHTLFVTPWVVLLNTGKLKSVRIQEVKNGFTICQHIHFRKILPILKKMKISVLFTPHAEEKNIGGIDIIPFPHLSKNGAPPSEQKDIWFSFVGRHTHICRKKIFNLPPMPNVIVRNVSKTPPLDQEYKDILSRSRFSLCPRGTGPSSIRFWESLEAGAIPVVIADAMRLPPNFNWERCIIRVPENQIAKIPSILRDISEAQEKSMQKACLEAYQQFSGDNLASVVHDYFSKKEG